MNQIWGQGKEMWDRKKKRQYGEQMSFKVCLWLSPPTYWSIICSSIQACEPTSPSVQINGINLTGSVVVLNEKNGWHTMDTQ